MKSTIGEKIRSRLKEIGKPQSWLAEQANVSDTAVSKWISTGKISRQSAQDVAKLLGISVDDLFGAENPGEEKAQNQGQSLALIYADIEEIRLLTIYREANELGRKLIWTAASAAPRNESLQATPLPTNKP